MTRAPSFFISAWLLALAIPAPSAPAAAPHEQVARVTTNRVVVPQLRRAFEFPKAGVIFDTCFDAARLGNVQQTGEASFTLTVEAENQPINDSAWYAFRAKCTETKAVSVTLRYSGGPHRYAPKMSKDGLSWQPVNPTPTIGTENGKSYKFTIELGPQPLFVAAQEIITSEAMEKWIAGLQSNPFVNHRVVGKSSYGKPLHLLEISEAGPKADLVLVLGRQHPPEVTGTLALKSFLTRVCEDDPEAVAFRRNFRLIVVPLVNPDGVDAGHWRHNAHGADLNRDWGQFNQPEPRQISSELLRIVKSSGARVRLGLDFHSTRKDVFYTTHALGMEDTVATRWLAALQNLTSEYKVHTEGAPTQSGRQTYSAASWMRQAFSAPAITYEVGDTTDRQLISRVARDGALALMRTLAATGEPIANPVTQAGKIRVALYEGQGVSGQGPAKILRYFNASTNISVRVITAQQIGAGDLRECNVVIFPGGTGSGQSKALGEAGRQEVQKFIREGGGYIGICAGAYLACASSSGLHVMDARTVSPKWERGTGMVGIKLSPAGMRTLNGSDAESLVKYQNGPILMPAEAPDIEDYVTLATFTTEVAENNTPVGIMKGAPAVVAGRLGKGRVVCFSPHPEQTPGLEPLLENAILWAAEPRYAGGDD